MVFSDIFTSKFSFLAFSKATYREFFSFNIECSTYSINLRFLPIFRVPKRIRKIGGKNIEERAEEINNREEFGHFEADTVLGKRGTKEAVLALTGRKTRLEMVRKIPDKTAESVIKELSKIITEYPGMIIFL